MTPVNEELPPAEDPYASLFRPEEPSATPSETGRVFRSQGVTGHEDALMAVPANKAGKLRTLTRDTTVSTDVLTVSSGASAPEKVVTVDVSEHSDRGEPAPRVRTSSRAAVVGSLTAPLVYAITIGVTLVFGLGNVLIFGGQPGALTGIGLIGATLFVSIAVQQSDDIHAIYAPAIAFFVTAITVGQINVTATSILDRAIDVFFVLGQNWLWIIGSTVIALTIVALRRRSLR